MATNLDFKFVKDVLMNIRSFVFDSMQYTQEQKEQLRKQFALPDLVSDSYTAGKIQAYKEVLQGFDSSLCYLEQEITKKVKK